MNDMETDSTTEKGSQGCKDGLGVNREGNAILCYAWGETDRPDAYLAKTDEDVRRFLITEAFGNDKDPMLGEWMQELATWDWDEDGELEWNFEIGGVRLVDVCVPVESSWLEYDRETPPESIVPGFEEQENDCVAKLLNGIPTEGGSATKRNFEMLIRMAFQGGLVAATRTDVPWQTRN